MARTVKEGLDYFPYDVNFLEDRRVRRLVRKHGIVAACALMALQSLVYRERGYYLEWNEDVCFDLSEMVDTDMDTVHAIMTDAIQAGFFDEGKFKEHSVLTSRAIQEQYLVCTQKRKSVVIEEKYNLRNEAVENGRQNESSTVLNDSSTVLNDTQTTLWGEKMSVSDPEMQQRKEKERKEKEEESEVAGRKVPRYCLNKQTHNCDGLLYRLAEIRVKEDKEIEAILKISNYGRIGHPVWGIISHNNWPRGNVIKMPGKFILARLKEGR